MSRIADGLLDGRRGEAPMTDLVVQLENSKLLLMKKFRVHKIAIMILILWLHHPQALKCR